MVFHTVLAVGAFLCASNTEHLNTKNSMEGMDLTIVTTEDPPFTKVRDRDGKILPDWRTWSGWIPAMIRKVSKEARFTYTLQLNSGTTTNHTQSDKDLVNGKYRSNNQSGTFAEKDRGGYGNQSASVNWAAAYTNVERLDTTELTCPFHSSPLSLLVQLKPGPTWFFQFLIPFDGDLWGAWLGAIVVTAIAFVLLDGDNLQRSSALAGKGHPKDKGAGMFDGQAFTSLRAFRDSIMSSLYINGVGAGGLDAAEPNTILARLLLLMFSWLSLVMIAAYTAKLAVFMSVESHEVTVRSIDELRAEASGHKACVLEGSAYAKDLKGLLSARYGTIEQVGKADLDAMKDGLLKGHCDGIIERNMHLEYLAVMNKEHNFAISDVLRDGPQTLAVQVKRGAFPQNPVQDKLAFWLSRLSASGELKSLYDLEVLRGVPREAALDDDHVNLGFDHFKGITVIFASLCLLLLLWQFVVWKLKAYGYTNKDKRAIYQIADVKRGKYKDKHKEMLARLIEYVQFSDNKPLNEQKRVE